MQSVLLRVVILLGSDSALQSGTGAKNDGIAFGASFPSY